MKRRVLLILVVCLLCGLFSGYAAVCETPQRDSAMPQTKVYIDGQPEYMGCRVDGTVYVPLRSFCGGVNLGAVVRWNGETNTMTVSMTENGEARLLTATVGNVYLYIDDRIVYLERPILQQEGTVLVPLLPLASAFGVAVEINDMGIFLGTENLQLCESNVYNPEDLKWLSHIIHAEAGNQSLEGQICVGNVVLNRVKDARFPDTVYGVIFSPNQFCPVKSGTVYCTPDADAVAAAKLCLEGVNLAGESTYFVNPVTGSTAWFREHLTYAMSVGDHDFYF